MTSRRRGGAAVTTRNHWHGAGVPGHGPGKRRALPGVHHMGISGGIYQSCARVSALTKGLTPGETLARDPWWHLNPRRWRDPATYVAGSLSSGRPRSSCPRPVGDGPAGLTPRPEPSTLAPEDPRNPRNPRILES